jgi:glycine/D-amino acid oxidase-like deaminating enzyme
MSKEFRVIQHFDVLIVGGGIAGIAIAEFLSRHSNLRIKVIEAAAKLGSGASGKLEGWFHSGTLYSGQEDPQTFMNCLNSLEDLHNLYSTFFRGRCNMELEEIRQDTFVPRSRGQGWFSNSPLYYVLPSKNSPEIRLSHLSNDWMYWKVQQRRILNRLESAFVNHNWNHEGRCISPRLEQIESHANGVHSSMMTCENGALQQVCARFQQSFGLEGVLSQMLRSTDVPMDTTSIMRDLVASAIANGVEFQTGITIERLVTQPHSPLNVSSVLCKDSNGNLLHLKSRSFILTMGAGLKDVLPTLGLRARIATSKSTMIVVSPALCNVSFARLSLKSRFHFNHLLRQEKDDSVPCSMLADSGAEREAGDNVSGVDSLLEAAERYFSAEELYRRKVISYECLKTEFISSEDEKRRYSYWIEQNGNAISVLPGKFTFFPTVAYQTFLNLKSMLGFEVRESTSVYLPNPRYEMLARSLVAPSFAQTVLRQTGNLTLQPDASGMAGEAAESLGLTG